MDTSTVIEFYNGDDLITTVHSAIVPAEGAQVSIAGNTWYVINVGYAVDHSQKTFNRRVMRACVDLAKEYDEGVS